MAINLPSASDNLAFYAGDTFAYWNGPAPQPDEDDYGRVMDLLERVHVNANLVAECIDTWRDALVGNDPDWYLTRNGERPEGEDAGIAKAEQLLQSWWEWQRSLASRQRRQAPITEAVAQMLTTDPDATGIGSAYLRVYSPLRYRDAKLPPEESYRKIGLQLCPPGSVEVERDDDNLIWQFKYKWSTPNGGSRTETHELLESGLTRSTYADGSVAEYDLGGLLPIVEMSGPCLITQSIRSLQLALNTTLTMCGQNVSLAGFVERVILNAQMPGEWEDRGGREVFVPSTEAVQFGPGRAPFLVGVPVGDPANPSGYTTPSISYRDPSPVVTFTDSFDLLRTAFYQAMGLGHLLSAGDGSLSGVSRIHIKDNWITRLGLYRPIVETAIADIFRIVLLQLQGMKAVDAKNLEPVVELRLNIGRPLPEEQTAVIANYNAGLISRTRAMSGVGVEDPDAELELINREREEAAQAGAERLQAREPDSEAGGSANNTPTDSGMAQS